ncbi:MAG: YlxR family protein [Clostridia bacterium]|nr:YlxR family protein [Clostridia bacterium]
MTEKKQPVRTCIACRAEFAKKELLRIVKSKDGEIFVDASGKANGRGAYICGKAECVKKLNKAKLLDRVFGLPVPSEIYQSIEGEILAKQ